MLNDLIQAYALGCLGIEEIRKLRKATAGNPEFNVKDLGKYQNLTALFPLNLPVEIPDPKVKERIARKLYRLKDDAGVKRLSEESSAYRTDTSKDIAREIISRTVTSDSSQGRDTKAKTTGQNKSTAAGEMRKSRDFQDIRILPERRFRRFSNKTLTYVLAGTFFLGLLLGFFFFYESKDIYLEEISNLNKEVHELNNELIVHNGLLTLLEKRDTKIFSLTGSEVYPDGFGKVYVNNSSNRAYLYVSGVPGASEGRAYQLWIINSGTVIPAGIFNPKSNSGFFFFSFPRLDYTRNIRYLVTEEPEGGSAKPGRRVYLSN
jgi:anti-sigma-K factor RskA